MIVGQCTDLVISKLESETTWKKTAAANNVVELLKMIQDIAYKYETQSYPFKAVHNTMRTFYLLHQKDNYTLEQYIESFLNIINGIKHSDGNINEHPKLALSLCQLDGTKDSMDAS
eukprot:7372102-Ditylum_brightwellii.AAC.1